MSNSLLEVQEALQRAKTELELSEHATLAQVINYCLNDRQEWIDATKAANLRFKQAEQRLWELKDRG